MAEVRCDWCEAVPTGAVRFCTACGAPLRVAAEPSAAGAERRSGARPAVARLATPPDAPVPPGVAEAIRVAQAARAAPASALEPVEPLLVHCPVCEASNAPSRERCGRCGADLATGAGAVAGGGVAGDEDDVTGGDSADSPSFVATVFVVVGVALVGVLATTVVLRSFGVIDPLSDDAGVRVIAVQASSTLPPTGAEAFGPRNLLDGDPGTAWVGGSAGAGAGEWVELRLAEPVDVARIVLWNGHQGDGRFAEYGRVARLRIVVGGEPLVADVLEVDGPQAIDLPVPVTTELVRLEVAGATPGSRADGAALSGVAVHPPDAVSP